MTVSRYKSMFFALALSCAVLCTIPVLAAEETISISYRGAGGNYIGDTIIFDGINTIGNTTVISVTGPNLPAAGVPLYALSGTPGTGNSATVDSRKQWKFVWDMSMIDTSLLQTARYTFTVHDIDRPDLTASTSVLLKQPEFYLRIKPETLLNGDYVEIDGMAETGVDYIKLDVTDASGTVLHTFVTPVTLGFFEHGFHIDMQPGQYYVTGTNPAMKKTLKQSLVVSKPETTTAAIPTEVTVTEGPTAPAATGTTVAETTPPETTAAPVKTQSGNFTATFALSLIGLGAAAVWFSRR